MTYKKCPNCDFIGTDEDIKRHACRNKKLKMLFVDDRTKRLNYALQVYGEFHDVTIATCVSEALRLMVAQKWDIIDLDHDLNGHDFQDPDTPTSGMEIVRYIKKCGGWFLKYTPIFRIHSTNLFAAHLMEIELISMGLRVYYSPIVYKTENMKYDKEGLPIIERGVPE